MPDPQAERALEIIENYGATLSEYGALVGQYGAMILNSGLVQLAATAAQDLPPPPVRNARATPTRSNGMAESAIDSSRSYSPEQAASALGVKLNSIRAYIQQGKLEASKNEAGQTLIPGHEILKRQQTKNKFASAARPSSEHQSGETHGPQNIVPAGTPAIGRVTKETERDAAA